MRQIIKEDLKEYLRNKKIIFVMGIIFFIMLSAYASGFFQIAYLLFFKPTNAIPFPISITYYLLFLLIPMIVLLVGHDSISGEIENKNIRGIISKVSRRSYILAKFLSLWIIVLGIILTLLIIAMTYSFVKFNTSYVPIEFFVYLSLYSLGLCSISVFFASFVSRSSTALSLKLFFLIVLLYLNNLPISSISIFHHIEAVFKMQTTVIWLYITYAAVFLPSSMIIFERRDL